jgi:hypothetical protein
MQTHIILLLILSFIGCVQPQNWVGTYTPDSSCPTASCCCISGQVVVTTVSANMVSFTAGLSGILCVSTTYAANLTTPTTYVTTISISGIPVTLTLSSDSLSITVTNSFIASCDATLTKNAAATTAVTHTTSSFANSISQSNICLLFIMALIDLMRSV